MKTLKKVKSLLITLASFLIVTVVLVKLFEYVHDHIYKMFWMTRLVSAMPYLFMILLAVRALIKEYYISRDRADYASQDDSDNEGDDSKTPLGLADYLVVGLHSATIISCTIVMYFIFIWGTDSASLLDALLGSFGYMSWFWYYVFMIKEDTSSQNVSNLPPTF